MWNRIVGVVLIGFFCLGRSFAYWGIPQLHVFVAEITLALFFLLGPRTQYGRWIWVGMRAPLLHRFKSALVLLVGCGVFQVVRGIFAGYPLLLVLRDFALDYYPFYFFIGLWAGLQDREFLPKLFRFAAWVNAIYGTLYVLYFNRISWSFPGFSDISDPVAILGMPEFSAVILFGLLSFEPDLRRIWPLLLLNAFVLIGMLIRAEWLAFVLGIGVWALLTKNVRKVAVAGASVAILFVVMALFHISIPGPETRGGVISPSDILARVIAPANKDAAAAYSSDTSDLQMYEANALWRTIFWAEIWTTVHEDNGRALFGYGYGYPLKDLVPDLAGEAARTPHNVFFYVLAYTGWVGVLIFTNFQITLAKLLWDAHRSTGNPFGITLCAGLMTFALFTPFFEVPHGAVPFYLLVGIACADLFRPISRRVTDFATQPGASSITAELGPA